MELAPVEELRHDVSNLPELDSQASEVTADLHGCNNLAIKRVSGLSMRESNSRRN
jgi:hypothetical protein